MARSIRRFSRLACFTRLPQSAPSFARGMSIAPGRAPFGRPAIPIDIAAPAYHWSVLKITLLIFFFVGLACDRDFLALVDLDVLFFDILHPLLPIPHCPHISRGPAAGHSRAEKKLFNRSSAKSFLVYELKGLSAHDLNLTPAAALS